MTRRATPSDKAHGCPLFEMIFVIRNLLYFMDWGSWYRFQDTRKILCCLRSMHFC
ncbi:unnamed protein product [Onchocerca flexuosa]|uniref:Transposase n=1 Tax=Onchocerca flexuosa TaxID=387005 RepID=A0A183HXJ2_9BILA|nr:unnamed protein product [Onchocerca flexuosa]